MANRVVFGRKKCIFGQAKIFGQQASIAMPAMGAIAPTKNSEWIESKCCDNGKLRSRCWISGFCEIRHVLDSKMPYIEFFT